MFELGEFNQGNNRLLRIGQQKHVHIWMPVLEGSQEKKIVDHLLYLQKEHKEGGHEDRAHAPYQENRFNFVRFLGCSLLLLLL